MEVYFELGYVNLLEQKSPVFMFHILTTSGLKLSVAATRRVANMFLFMPSFL